MARTPDRTTVDLSGYPDLVVIYLGMRVNSIEGLRTLLSFGPKIRRSVEADRGGTGFWHETYSRNGQVESVYIDMPRIGLASFAPTQPARGSMFSARRRLGLSERNGPPPAISEGELYGP